MKPDRDRTISSLKGAVGVFLAAALLSGCATQGGAPPGDISEPLFKTASVSEAGGDYVTAADHYKKIHDRRPQDRAALLGLARNLRYSGNARIALKILKAASKDFQDDGLFLTELGKVHIATSNAEAAVKTLKAAIAKDSRNWEAYATLGVGNDLLQAYPEAWEAYQKALEISPNNPAVLNNMALSAALGGRIELAISTLEGAPIAVRRTPQVRQNLAFFYGIKGNLKKAEALAKMDLDEKSVRNNLNIYSRFHKKSHKRKAK
ncbi:MAG: tetratricopeptide repeat protein [Rhodospirillales bacterium]